MKGLLRIAFLFFYFSVGAQNSDTSYFDYNWNPVEKSDRKMYFINIRHSNSEKFYITSFTYKGDPYHYSEYLDEKFERRNGLTFWMDKHSDTTEKRIYSSGILMEKVFFEKNIPYEKTVFSGPNSKYVYTIVNGKMVSSKTLYTDSLIYKFRGKDSVLFLNNLQFAFREEEPFKNNWVFKFKILPWTMGDDGGMNYSLGLEYTFRKIHSIDLTGTYLDWQQDMDDASGNDLPPLFQVRRGLQLSYRYYFQFYDMNKKFRMFFSPFIRYSKFKDYYLEGTPTNYFRNEANNYSGGLLLGFCVDGTGGYDPFYTEFFVGPQFVFSELAEGFIQDNLSIEREFADSKLGLRFGMNFCGLLSRKK